MKWAAYMIVEPSLWSADCRYILQLRQTDESRARGEGLFDTRREAVFNWIDRDIARDLKYALGLMPKKMRKKWLKALLDIENDEKKEEEE